MKKAVVIILILSLALSLGAENFIVESYDIEITASPDSTLHVKETINVDFTAPSHGIYRDIKYRFSNPDGNFADPVIAVVSSFRSDDLYRTEKEDGYYRFYLGSGDVYTTGERKYVIEYDYSLGRDLRKGYDELYYNIVSPAWDTPIWNITWSVTFPKEIDSGRVEVFVGEEGSTKEGNFTVDDDLLRVSGTQSGLMNYGTLTLKVEMEEGYWTGLEEKEDNSGIYLVISASVSSFLLILSFLLWFLFGRDRPYSPTPSVDIPDALTPMEVRYILEDGKLRYDRDLLAMILYWAEKGYVKIIDKDDDKFTILKLKNIEENAEDSGRDLFNLVFKEGEKKTTFYSILESKYPDKYSRTARKTGKKFSKGEKSLKNRTSTTIEAVLLCSFLALSIADGILMSMKFPGILSFIFSLILVILYVVSAVSGTLYQGRREIWTKAKRIAAIELPCATALLAVVILLLLAKMTFLDAPMITWTVIISVISISLGTFISSHVEEKSKYGHDIYERCLGLRMYIADKGGKDDDRARYGALLPYAVALGMDNKWVESHRNILYEAPQWYEREATGPYVDTFPVWYTITSTMNKSYKAEHSKYVSSTSSSSSSGFAGGGFSGGGGGSW